MSFKTSIQRDLDRFYKVLSDDSFNIREVTKGALTQARSKLNPWGFQRLNEIAVTTFYDRAEYYGWNGHRVLAIDGTRLILPRHETTIEEFGEHGFGPKADSKRCMAMGSMLYDVLNHLTIDAQIGPYSGCSEQDLLMKHLDKVVPGDLLLLDRGYAAFWLFFLLYAKGIHFCIRLPENWWLAAKDFIKSSDTDREVRFKLPIKDRDKLSDYAELWNEKLTFRLVKVVKEDGTVEVLCTDLLDKDKYKKEDFQELYHLRWNIEEAYKLLKSRVDLEDFSGKTARAVKQDFFAKIFMLTLCAAFAHPIEEKVRKEYAADQDRKHDQQINKTNAVATLCDILIPMFLKRRYKDALHHFDKMVYSTREIIRPNRTVKRNHRKKKFRDMNYKKL